MNGIQFVIDDKGAKTAVVIDLRKHARVWEDFYDGMLASLRAKEPRESLESVKARFRRPAGFVAPKTVRGKRDCADSLLH